MILPIHSHPKFWGRLCILTKRGKLPVPAVQKRGKNRRRDVISVEFPIILIISQVLFYAKRKFFIYREFSLFLCRSRRALPCGKVLPDHTYSESQEKMRLVPLQKASVTPAS